MQRAGSALTTAGNDIDESTAMIAAANTVVQDPEKVGNGLRTIALRLTGTKAAAESLQEMGEETEGMIQTESKLRQTIMDATKTAKNTKGFDIMTDSGQYKSTYEILQGIADIWEDIGEMDKATGNTNQNLLLETMAGKNRANILAAILQSPDILQSAYIDSQNSEGSAQEELDKYLESIEGKMQKFRNATQELASDLLSSDLIKFFVDFGTAGVHALDGLAKHINIVTVALSALVAIGAKKMGNPLLTLERGENGLRFETFFDRLRESAVIESDDDDITKFFEEQKAIQKYENEQKRQMKMMAKARAKSGETEAPKRRLKSSASTLKSTNYTDAEMDFIKQLQAERKRMGEFLKSVGHKSDVIAAAHDKVLNDNLTKFQKEQAAQGRKVNTAKIREAVESNEQPKIRTIKGTKSGKKLGTDTTNLLKSGKQFKSIEGSVDSLSAKMGTLTERYAKWKGETQKSIPIMEGFTKALETEPGKYSNDFKGMLSYIRQSGVGLQAMKTTLIGIGSQIVSMMASMAVAMVAAVALQKVIEGLEYIVHYSDHMIENGQQARNTVNEINDSINNTRSTIQSLGKTKITDTTQEEEKNVKNLGTSIDQIAKKYTDLKRGVGSDNENLFLSEDEYSEFIDISNKLAEAIPDLKYGTDSSGNAILALGDNAAESAEKIRELYNETQKLNASDIEKNFGIGIRGLKYEMQDLEKKYGKYSTVGSEFSWENMFANGDEVVEHFRERMEMAKQAESAIEEYSDVFQKTGISSQHNTDWALQAGDQSGQLMEGASATGENLATSAETLKDNIKNGLDEAERYNAETRQLLSEFSSYTSQFLSSREVFGELDYDLQNTITKSFAVNKGYFADLFAEVDYDETKYKSALYERFIDPLETISNDIEKQQSLKDLLEQKVGDMTPEQFKKNYQSQLQNIFGDAYTENLDKMFGFDERYNQYQKYIDAIKKEFTREGTEALRSEDVKDILGMSTSDLEIAYKILLDSDDAIKSFDILQQKIDETKENTVEATSYLNDYIASQGKANTANYTKVAETTAAEATNMARGIRNEDYSRLIGGFDKTTTPTISAPALIPNYEGLSSAVTAYSKAYGNMMKQALSSPEVKSAIEAGTDLADIKLNIDTSAAEQFQTALQNITPYFEELNLSQEQFNEFVAQGSANVYSLFETFDTQQRAMEYFTDDGLGVYSFMKDVIDATKESKELDKAFIDIGKDGKVSFKKNEKSIKALSQKLNISTEAAGYLLDAAKDIGAVDIGTIYAQAGKNSLSGFLADLAAVSAAMSEISQNGYLTYDTMTALVTANGAYADGLVNTASGMILNTEEMREMNEQAAVLATAEIQGSVEELTDKYLKNTQVLSNFTKTGGNVKDVLTRIENANGDLAKAIEGTSYSAEQFQDIWSAYSENQSLENTIIDLQRQQSEIRANVSLMQEYKNALQTPNMNANFLTTVSGKEGADKLYEQGWLGVDDFVTYAKLIGQNGWDDKTAILNYEQSLENVGKYLTEDASGVYAFWDAVIAKGEDLGVTFDNLDGYKFDPEKMNMEKIAEAMDVSTEFAENFALALHDAGQMDLDLSVISDGIRSDLSTLGSNPLNDERTLKNAITLTQKMGDGVESATDKLKIMQTLQDQMLNGKLSQEMLDYANETLTNVKLTDEGQIQATTDVVKDAVDGVKNHIEEYRNEADAASKTELFKNVQSDIRALSNIDIPTLNKALNLNLDADATKDQIIDAIASVTDMTDAEKLSLKLGIEIPEDTTAEVQRQLSDLQDAMDHLNELKLNPKVSTEELDGAMNSVIRIANAMDAESRKQFLAHFGIEVDEQGVINVEQTKANLGQPVQTTATVYVPQDTLNKLTALQSIVKDVGREHDGEVVIEGSEDAQEEVQALADELAQIPQEKLIEYGFIPGKNGKITADDIKSQIGSIDLTANVKALPTVGNSQNVSVNVTGNLKEGADNVNALNSALGRLSQRGAITVSVDTSVAQSQIQGLRDTLTTLGGTVTQPHVAMEKAGFESGAIVVNATLDSIGEKVVQPTVSMNYDAFRSGASDVRTQMNQLGGLSASPSIYVNDYASSTLRDIRNLIDGLTTSKTITITTKRVTEYSSVTKASGTVTREAQATGTVHAYAGGTPNNTDITVKQDETALVNEIGTESWVHNGKWSLIPGGAHFMKLHRGDIVFSVKQTSELLKSGKVTSDGGHGKLALANGTVNAYYNSSVTTKGGWGDVVNKSKQNTGSSSDSSSDNSTSQAAKDTSKAAKSVANAAKEAVDEVFDWIEVRIDRLERQIEHFDSIANNTGISWGTRFSNIDKEIGKVQTEKTTQNNAYNRYIKEANKVGLSEGYKKLVQNGKIDITKVKDEKLAERIKNYQEWYEKALDCKDAIDELNVSLGELYQTKFEQKQTFYEEYIGYQDSLTELNKYLRGGYHSSSTRDTWDENVKNVNAALKEADALQATLDSAVKSKAITAGSEAWYEMKQAINEAKLAAYEYQQALIDAIKEHRQLITERHEASQEYQRNRGSYNAERNYAKEEVANQKKLVSELRTAIDYNIRKNGEGYIGSDAYQEQVLELSNAYNSLSEAYKAVIDLDKEHFETLIDMNDALSENTQNAYENAEAFGEYESMWKYNQQITALNDSKELKEQELKAMTADLNEAVRSGAIKQGSTEWLEQMIAIQNVRNEIQGYDNDMEEAYQKMLEVEYAEMFDRVIEKMDKFIDKLDTINGLLTDEMMYDYDTGKLTETGALAIVLNNNALDAGIEKLQKYVEQRQKIIQDYNTGKYGKQTFDENMAEVEANINSTLNEVNSSRNAILDIIKNQTKAELDAINKVIDARKEALQKKKDYYDYDKQLKDKNKEIQLLQQQIQALDGVADAESRAKKARLEAQLAEAQQDLDETVQEHVYQLQVTGLDDLQKKLEEDYEKYVAEISKSMDNITSAINTAVETSGSNIETATETLNNTLLGIGAGFTTPVYEDITNTPEFEDVVNSDDTEKITDAIDQGFKDLNIEEHIEQTVEDAKPAKTETDIANGYNGTFSIASSKDSSFVLDITSGSTEAGANAQLYKSNGGKAQQFQFLKNADGTYTIKNVKSGLVLNVEKSGNVRQQKSNGSNAQKWTIVENKDGSVSFKSLSNGKYLDISGNSMTNKTNIGTYEPNGSTAQKFFLKRLALGSKGVGKTGTYLTQENGSELLVTKYGMLTPLSKGDGVVPAEMTKKLYDMALNYDKFDTSGFKLPNIEGTVNNKNTVNYTVGDINISGSTNLTRKDLDEFRSQIVQDVKNAITADMRKFGYKPALA